MIMIWTDLDFTTQEKVIDKIVELLKNEDDDLVQDGLMAAVHELELWSNRPIPETEEPFIAQAQYVEPEE